MQDLAISTETGARLAALEPRALADARRADRAGEASEAALGFEKLLATILVKEMRRGLPEGFFGNGTGSNVYEGWLDEHVGASLTEGRGLGLRIALERELSGRGSEVTR